MEVISLVFSGLAAIGSFISVFTTIRQGYATIIASKRFDWMNDVRQKISQFIEIYYDSNLLNDIKAKKLHAKKAEIELYVDSRSNAGYDNRDHQSIIQALDACISSLEENESKQKLCIETLVKNVQICLATAHSRAKDEAEVFKNHF